MEGSLAPPRLRPRRKVLPGFGLTLGVTLLWLSAIVLIPLAALALRPWELGPAGLLASIAEPRVLAALRLSFGGALLAAALDVPLGLLLAWVLTRYHFPGRRLADAMVDLPFALPTAVAGVALTALYAPNGWLGAPLAAAFGWRGAFPPAGGGVALAFLRLPLLLRTLAPGVRAPPRGAGVAGG